ncbi:glycosyltransferase family 90 protein [Diplogelasinospora grovesii]|uniref:Glycosyltransferase family 90 protein n=1 Tax=Diplogelasinospora grovesii TaxID=303347 RepID=A0AAN6S721_9PEZI|nr:glycosyltransferase family 90 protein [Diplogelasinospora grovesii]
MNAGMGMMVRPRQLVIFGTLVFLAYCTYSLFWSTFSTTMTTTPSSYPSSSESSGQPRIPIQKPVPTTDPQSGPINPLPPPLIIDPKPKPAPQGSHPIWHLITDGERELEETKQRQSRTLAEAVAEYRRRYGMPPPPNFDRWWAFAKSKDVQLPDEFDMIYELITPFWGLKPSTVRARAREALGFDNALLGVQIRGGNVTNVEGAGNPWQKDATRGMMASFVEFLPDMDLAFNVHDEPRVVVPHEDMARLVERAKTVNMPAANANAVGKKPRNEFTGRPADLNEGSRFEETKLTRFNIFAHQPTWTHSRMSCPPDSPTRRLEEDERVDDVGRYGLSALGFVYNMTAMSDICLSPSLSETFGFFDRPNAYNVVHDLFPIFSQSKISSYADILYPSPWYWFEKVPYDEKKDMEWAEKADQLYWRGSTTGGYSRNGGWRRQHRQRFVQKINAADNAKILVNPDSTNQEWEVKEVPRGDYKGLMDVYFSHVGQCDQGDCDAQKEFFTIKEYADQEDAYKYKYVLDLDGNAFSGRFYAFLKSKSLVYKWAVFREWHYEWLKSWVHYIPLSLQGDDWLEAVRFFGDGNLGKKEAERMGMQGREWANKVLRHEDMEVWFFRLLLEYGRVIDDDRDKIGFSV